MSPKYQPVKYYYIAKPSYWPIMGSVGLFLSVLGFVQLLHQGVYGPYLLGFGIFMLLTTMIGWFSYVIRESVTGLHSEQMDQTYRWAMLWFIVSEISLFTVFFIALFYVRIFILPEIAGTPYPLAKALLMAKSGATHHYLWPHFQYTWPLLQNPNPTLYVGPREVMNTWGIPALNTLILLSSALTLTWAHWGLVKEKHQQLLIGLVITILLGLTFEALQIHEYVLAYEEFGLTLGSGIYGSTFFALTGLHAMHVSIGLIMLMVILLRTLRGHFSAEHHFAFAAVSWYWHFVDVVWLFLFVFVYWL